MDVPSFLENFFELPREFAVGRQNVASRFLTERVQFLLLMAGVSDDHGAELPKSSRYSHRFLPEIAEVEDNDIARFRIGIRGEDRLRSACTHGLHQPTRPHQVRFDDANDHFLITGVTVMPSGTSCPRTKALRNTVPSEFARRKPPWSIQPLPVADQSTSAFGII